MSKIIFHGDEAREKILAGAKALYEAVSVTMGPKGRNVVIDKDFGSPIVTHDGVTVAKEIDLDSSNPATLGYKTGAELVKQAASKMNDIAGDGTTTATILTYHLFAEAHKLIAAGHNPMDLKKELEAAVTESLSLLDSFGEDIVGNQKRVAEVATISAADAQIGSLIADVMQKVGRDGIVTVEEGNMLMMESDVVEGFTFDKGFVSPYMVTDTARMEAVYDKPAILITDKKVSALQEFLPVLEKVAASGKKDLVIIAEDVDGEALGTLILNKLKGVFNTVAVKAPAFGDKRKETLEDIAILTGGKVISEELGISFDEVDASMLGSARRVIVSKDQTTIIEGSGPTEALAERIEQIKSQVENASSEYEVEGLQQRAATLGGKVAVIRVGGATETEIAEKKFRVDDAVAAVKAALEQGIVPGGGVTLVNLSSKLKASGPGAELLRVALLQPFLKIIDNAGLNSQALLAEVQKSAKPGFGFDVNNAEGGLQNMKSIGVVDPKMVTRWAIENAASIAKTGMTAGALIVEKPSTDDSKLEDSNDHLGL